MTAAIETIAEVGYARASLARIADRLGISRGLISYHFADKDELIAQVVTEVVEQGKTYMRLRIVPEMSTGSGFLRSYIESNLAFMRKHRAYMVTLVEISRGTLVAGGPTRIGLWDADLHDAEVVLRDHLARYQAAGEFRPDFDPTAMAIAIRAVIDAMPHRLTFDPDFDVDSYVREVARTFDLATRVEATR